MSSHEPAVDLARIEVLSFDCYGTLIDWETGILGALRPVLAAHGVEISDSALLRLYSEIEPALQSSSYRSYRVILRETMVDLGSRLGFSPSPSEREVLAESLPEWRAFPDTVPALRALASRYQLGVLSNIDDDLFAATSARLGIEFAHVVTAARVRSYKPAPAQFVELLRRTGLPPDRHGHAAESLFHDIAPAKSLGMTSVWVQRSHAVREASASRRIAVNPSTSVADMNGLAHLLVHG